ncbi:hypothetical protein [Streptomyces zagrosensis]|uniref:Uncharacterized protein n=1 Tax=Streptomyces zagrosensis TaxID=1042984 RepID=A0A7W9UZN6_9ACTN|nr:hypothetical protein [Streptomyces zagrosensis]MBB5937230.1 hypothetical protein [Streptomyces zagrosensis]
MAAPQSAHLRPVEEMGESSSALADAFELDPTGCDTGRLLVWLGGGEEEGDTTGDGCGESPPQGPTTGC